MATLPGLIRWDGIKSKIIRLQRSCLWPELRRGERADEAKVGSEGELRCLEQGWLRRVRIHSLLWMIDKWKSREKPVGGQGKFNLRVVTLFERGSMTVEKIRPTLAKHSRHSFHKTTPLVWGPNCTGFEMRSVCGKKRVKTRTGSKLINYIWVSWIDVGAGDGIWTRDFNLGKVALYHWVTPALEHVLYSY